MCSHFDGETNSEQRTPNVERPTRRRAALEVGCLATLLLILSASSVVAQETTGPSRTLRVAADPNNLPFSNERREGFENKIAELIARELNAGVEYTWRAQRRGFFRETLKESQVDLVPGVPANSDRALTTTPYYRSS